MKFQVILLLGLMCSSTLSFDQKFEAIEGTNKYQVGEETGKCCVRNDGGNAVCYDDAAPVGICGAKGIFWLSNKLWVVLQLNADANILVETNTHANTNAAYSASVVPAASLRDGTVLIGEIDTTSFKFIWLTLVAAKDATTNYDNFDVTSTMDCNSIIQITGDVATGFTLINQAGAQSTGVTGDGVHLTFNTGDNTFQGVAADSPVCTVEEEEAEEEEENEEENEGEEGGENGGGNEEEEENGEGEEEEEEEEEGNSASTLSVASVFLAFIGLFAL